MWKQMNIVINKAKNKDALTCIQTNYKYETNSLEIGNKFSEYFRIIALKLVVEKIYTRLNFWVCQIIKSLNLFYKGILIL